jgi:hypothetical protein
MIALAALHIAISRPLGYYWNALQAELSGVELTISGVPEPGDSSQGMLIYVLMFGMVALLAFVTSPRRTSIWWRLVLVAPLSVYLFSMYVEYDKISPVKEKFQDLYESLEYAIFVPYAAIAAATALYLAFVIALPAYRVTQVFGWVASVVAILSYLASVVFIVYNHTMTILDGGFGESEFYTYLLAFALDVVSYFFMISVLMTYCTIKREERWDVLEALAMEAEREENEAAAMAQRAPAARSAHLGGRVIPDVEELKKHEVSSPYGYADYKEYAARSNRSADNPRPDSLRSDSLRPDNPRPDSLRSDNPRPDDPRPNTLRSDNPRPDNPRPAPPRNTR